jgi:salicylate hydroxylase
LSGSTTSSPLLEDISIAIVGAGIGGLTLALALRHHGFHDVHIYEQHPEGRPDDASDQVIELTANGSRVLHALGLEKQLADSSSIPGFAYLRTRQSGFLLIQRPLGDFSEARYGAPTYVILYSRLVELLHDACVGRGVHLHYDTRIADLATETGELSTAAGPAGSYSAIVIADGATGSLHQIVSAEPPPPASAIHSIRAKSELPSALNAVVTWLHTGGFCIQYPTHAEQTDLLFVYHADETPDSAQRAEDLLRKALSDSHHHLSDALEGVQTANFLESGCPRVAEFWHAGKAGLLGDACHPLPGYESQGACAAIEDAWVLAVMMERWEEAPHEGFSDYQRYRRPRMNKMLTGTAEAVAELLADSRQQQFRRNLKWSLMNRFLPEMSMAKWDWLYAYNCIKGFA